LSDDSLQQTVFHDWHVSHGGRMVEFGGWRMPVQYSTIVEEHQCVRQAVGLFDIAHMGRLRFTGRDACRFLDSIVTNDVTKLAVGDIRYALVTNEQGGVLDDVLVYRFEDCYSLVVNASNRPKIVEWMNQHIGGFDVRMEDRTLSHAMLALQGPQALVVIKAAGCHVAESLRYYTAAESSVGDIPGIVSRTGYTGEDGVEVIVETARALELWERLVESGTPHGLKPCGLGCRDTLRLEAAMPLYGHELSDTVDPLTAGLAFGVKLEAADFVGKDALLKIRDAGIKRVRVGLELDGRRIAREGAEIFSSGSAVGEVTSGTFSPTLEKSISMGYIAPELSKSGTHVEVDIRGKRVDAVVVPMPFYRRVK
jgi:aminomethyltransferase